MITLIIPTRNRAHTLRRVLPSYYAQDDISEIIVVSDAGEDDTAALVEDCALRHPAIRTRFVRNESRQGASHSRNVGVALASNDYILFCDDDEYLEAGYARTCLTRLLGSGAGAVSGRRVYMQAGETPDQALRRFGKGVRRTAPFRKLICEYVNAAHFTHDIRQPLSNAIILTHRHLLLRFPYDSFYARGNGYREESDFQMNLFVHGFDILVTNDCHSIHLPLSQVRSGGQRTQAWRRVFWSIYYTRYFFSKYYAAYAKRVGLRWPAWMALTAFAVFAVYRETLRPPLQALASWLLQRGYLGNRIQRA
ncbi:MAG: glycosyltransferase family 2 protein [Rhodocyclaceae bacterium]